LEHFLKIDTGHFLHKYKKYQIPMAALLGSLPGCGGAIIVMTQYSIGRVGFGGVVATLTSTMGDAAFLLIAKEPITAAGVIITSIIVGIISGYAVEKIHGYDFCRINTAGGILQNFAKSFHFEHLKWPWVVLLIPGIFLGFLSAFQIDIDTFFSITGFEVFYGSTGAVFSLFLWFINPSTGPSITNRFEGETSEYVWDKTVVDTCFVTVWVIFAFLLFELPILWTEFDFREIFTTLGLLLPLIGILIGFLPGCGPQVITTTLYLQGFIPLSAQIGNAISNDGDALFPAIAISPRAAVIATLYTAIPALIVAYGYFFVFEHSA